MNRIAELAPEEKLAPPMEITCSQCGATAIVRRDLLGGWKVQHQRERHFGHPWSAFLVKKAVRQ